MAKYSKQLILRIADLIRTDSFTVREICSRVGISERCFYNWQKESAEFADSIRAAREFFRAEMVVEAEKSLRKLVNGFHYFEVKEIMKGGKVRETVVFKKYRGPVLQAIIFVLSNLDPDNWKNRYYTEAAGKNKAPLFPNSPLTTQRARELLKQLSDSKLDLRIQRANPRLVN